MPQSMATASLFIQIQKHDQILSKDWGIKIQMNHVNFSNNKNEFGPASSNKAGVVVHFQFHHNVLVSLLQRHAVKNFCIDTSAIFSKAILVLVRPIISIQA
jgi:hypothetical protein